MALEARQATRYTTPLDTAAGSSCDTSSSVGPPCTTPFWSTRSAYRLAVVPLYSFQIASEPFWPPAIASASPFGATVMGALSRTVPAGDTRATRAPLTAPRHSRRRR